MKADLIFCVAGLHRWEEKKLQLSGEVHREERHCKRCSKKQIHIRLYPNVRKLGVLRISNYVSYSKGDPVDTLTRHSLTPLV